MGSFFIVTIKKAVILFHQSFPSFFYVAGIFGNLTYSLIGDYSKHFNIDAVTGVITVANSTFLDRERLAEASFSAVATDKAPIATRRSSIVPVIVYFHKFFVISVGRLSLETNKTLN